jgi:hypothetical protein
MFNPEAEGAAAKEKIYIASQTRQNFDKLLGRILDKDKDLTWEQLILLALPFMHEAVIHEKWAAIFLWGAEHDKESLRNKTMNYHPSQNRLMREELINDLMTQVGIWIKEKADMLSDMGWKRGMTWEVTGKKSTGLLRAIREERR